MAAALALPALRAGATTAAAQPSAPLTLTSQSTLVTPAQPWFNIALGVNPNVGSASDLHVNLTFYARISADSQLQQALAGTPQEDVLGRDSGVPVTAAADGSLSAGACVTVVPDEEATPPATGVDICPAGNQNTLSLDCTPDTGECGDIYPVSVALERNGDSTPVARFTTFLTYQEPGIKASDGPGGPLLVGVIVPITPAGIVSEADALTQQHDVSATLAVSPAAVDRVETQRPKDGVRALSELAALDNAEVLDQSYVPINVATLAEKGLAGEIGLQVDRGNSILHGAGLKPGGGPWVDTVSSFTQGDGADLSTGVQVAGSNALVLNDQDLASINGVNGLTFAQPFTLDLGHGASVPAAASDSSLDTRFTAAPDNPVLGAEQLLAGLSFVHFENASLHQTRGMIIDPPADWKPSGTFLETLLGGLYANPALTPVTVSQLFTDVPAGGNGEPAVRHLQSGGPGHGMTNVSASRIALDRQQLTSFEHAVNGHPAELGQLSDGLLTTEARSLTTPGRNAALGAFSRAFEQETSKITLSTEHTITFTSRRAAIPVTVISNAPYPVHVVVSLASDKFTFPNGNSQEITLNHPTTSVRVVAQARGSGDRLPVDVTLRTADGRFVIARAVLLVHSTAISFVGVALTVLAGAVLLVWWVRTWRKSRRQRLRAAH